MTTLKFANTNNMLVFLAKPAESEGFEQIVDFLNAHTINSKTTAWNEFSSTMASAIICLATHQKFNFSKYIFECMVKNLENVYGKFLMYPRKPKRKDTEIPQSSSPTTNVADEAVNEDMDNSLVRAATTATSLDEEQDRGNINKTRSKATLNEPSSSGTSSELAYQEGQNPLKMKTDEDMFGVNDLDGDEVIVESIDVVKTAEETRSVVEEVTAVTIPVSAATTTTTTTAITDGTTTPTHTTTTYATTITVVSTRPRAKWLVIHEQEQAHTPTVSSQQPSQVKVHDKEERLAIEKPQQVEEANIAWDDVQAKIDADYQLAQRLQAQEQDEFTDAEKERLFVQFLEQRRKHFTAKRGEEKRNIPLTRAQQKSIMYTYLKNMEGWKPKSLKNKSFAIIQELFDKAMKMVNTFFDYRIELVEESSKKEETEIANESSLKRV
ncbi:hypothetical protein Tco_0679156 [Tanacetum coccineum]|uniref:Uncharacterized protein n=1 Tax=Tanacetum coccineum TaxID=301880 RepID=A0ABQ4XH62_9ASTR